MPVVLSTVAEPATLMKAPATVPEPVIENTTAALVDLTDGLAVVEALNEGVLRDPEYVGAFAKPTASHEACDACVSSPAD